MTKDEITRIALEAGFPKRLPEFYAGCFEKIIIEAYKQGRADEISRVYETYVDPVLAEREACAKVAEERLIDKANCTAEQMYEMLKTSIAEDIRARGNHG